MAHRDFSKTSTEQLLRSLRFHDNDTGTMTMEEECRRMYLVQEISAELRRRRERGNEAYRQHWHDTKHERAIGA